MASNRSKPAPGRPPAGDEPEPSSTLIGRAVRRARTAAGLTVTELARRAEVSQPFLSQIEAGKHSPSTATLYRLAAALDVPTAALLPSQDGDVEPATFVPAGGGTEVPFAANQGGDLTAHHLGRGGNTVFVPMLFELPPGYADPEPYQHAGEGFLYVLAGQLVMRIGEREQRLGRGDSLHYDASAPHTWRVRGSRPVRLLLVENTLPSAGR